MKSKEIIELLEGQINRGYNDLLFARSQRGYRKDWLEGFRSRLDELLLLWHIIHDISFIEACKEFGIDYQEVNTEPSKERKR